MYKFYGIDATTESEQRLKNVTSAFWSRISKVIRVAGRQQGNETQELTQVSDRDEFLLLTLCGPNDNGYFSACAGTLRLRRFTENGTHGSDSVESAAREIAYFFGEGEVCPRTND